MIKIVVIDERELDRRCIEATLSSQNDFEIIGFGKDGYDALKLVANLKPDIVVFDMYLEYVDGPGIIPLLKGKSPATAVLLFTSFEDDAHICRAIGAEVAGYLLKDTDMDKLTTTIRIVYNGGCFITPRITARIVHILSSLVKDTYLRTQDYHNTSHQNIPGQYAYQSIPASISKTELRVMTCIGQGKSNQEIAENLSLTPKTVRNYVSSAMQKTGLQNRAQIAVFAIKTGLINLGRVSF
ncbi:MAG: response regulator transcription factor [Treponema sp.]|jgi:DNA-binding NarL/FixJ family response regulator|nr:response regulator transcription factor [Treponema sp.]